MGGEEFLLLLPETKLEDALDLISAIREDFPAALLDEEAINLAYTFSAGLTEALPGETRSSILRRADRALYGAKTEGRNRTKIDHEFADATNNASC
jgi:diguanylate cyclase (GGDEF)-like protein